MMSDLYFRMYKLFNYKYVFIVKPNVLRFIFFSSSHGFQSIFSKTWYLEKSWRVFHGRSLFGRCFQGFFLPVLEYYSAVWCSAADTHLKLLDRAVSGPRFLTVGVFECDIAHRRSVAVLCMLYKIRYNPLHPLNGALPGPYVPARITRCALVHRLAAEPRSAAGLLFSSRCPSGSNDPANLVFDGAGLAGFKSKANASLLAFANK